MDRTTKSGCDPTEDQFSLSQWISTIAAMSEEHFALVEKLIPENRVPTDAIRHFLVTVLRRSLALIDGFLLMADHRNRCCALPLIRLQLDNVMRVFATCSIVSDREAFIEQILKGQKLHKFKSKDGRKLTDTLLHKELSKKYPPCSHAYEHSSGFIHLSWEHLFQVLDFGELMQGRALFADYRRLPEWPAKLYETEMLEFAGVTQILLEESQELASLRQS